MGYGYGIWLVYNPNIFKEKTSHIGHITIACFMKKDDAKNFVLYSLMGVFTTIIFWGTEIAFDALSQNPNSKYLGAIIGLSIGYIIKYFLDKKFVFIHKEIAT